VIIASLRSRNGEALKVAEKLQGGGHPNASGATMPKSVRTVSEAVSYLKQVLNPAPKADVPLNNLESLFAEIEAKGR
jgi:nanoRNase/pAp phosphatase (c-di-AMP/oligoRNAs hydrolase)